MEAVTEMESEQGGVAEAHADPGATADSSLSGRYYADSSSISSSITISSITLPPLGSGR